MEFSSRLVSEIRKVVPHDVYKYCTCGKVGKVDHGQLETSLEKVSLLLVSNGINIHDLLELLNRSQMSGADFIEKEGRIKFHNFGCVSIERICTMLPIWVLSQGQYSQFSIDPQPV